MSSKVDCSSCLAEISLYSVSSTVRRSPSSMSPEAVVSLMVRMSGSEAFDGAGFVGVHLDEILRSGHRQHRLDALLHAGELQVAAGVVHLAVEVHETADGGAVDVGDRRHVDQDVLLAGGDEAADRGREVREDR